MKAVPSESENGVKEGKELFKPPTQGRAVPSFTYISVVPAEKYIDSKWQTICFPKNSC